MLHYHNITTDDMNNGDGLRVVLWVSGCEHHCPGCQNPMTWDPDDGLEFNEVAKEEIFTELQKPYISGLTLSGGDPFYGKPVELVKFVREVRKKFPDKTIWAYTGYTWERIRRIVSAKLLLANELDVLVDGQFIEGLKDVNYPWVGSTNQRVIDVQQSLKEGRLILYESH